MGIRNKRIVALILDLLIIGIVSGLFSNFVGIERNLGTTTIFDRPVAYGYSLSFLFYLLYFFIFDLFNNSITIGKLVMKIKVILQNEDELTLKIKMYRTTLKTISILFLPISALVFLITGKSLQDSYCSTKIVDVNMFSEKEKERHL